MEEIKGHRRSFFSGVYGCFDFITGNISTEPNAGGSADTVSKVSQMVIELNQFQEDIKSGIA